MRWVPTFAKWPLEFASAQPAVDGLAMGAELRGELLDCHLVVAGPGNIPGPDRTPRAEPATLQQAPDHRRVEGLLLGWFPALDVQAIRNVLCGGIPPTHLGGPRDQTSTLFQLSELSG